MSTKILQFDGHFEHTGEARCQILDPRDRRLYKYASEDTQNYLSTVQPVDGRTIVLVLAMGASEYYGPNRNGDGFAERPVMVDGKWAVAKGETLPEHYHTFENHAHVYRHHINKDPAKSFGDVMKAFYNWRMHRVELLLSLDNALGNDVVGRIDGGEYPGVSMGCRIKYDVCSVCGNRAPTRAQYCEHVNGSNPEFGMNRLSPEGIRYFVWNPSPFLFDISFVFKPADKIGYMMKKVALFDEPYALQSSAALGARVESLSEKRALLQKVSDIDKMITGELASPREAVTMSEPEYHATRNILRTMRPWLSGGVPTVSQEAMAPLAQHSLPELLSSFNVLGMVPTAIEILRFICAQRGITSTPEAELRLVEATGKVASALADMPHVIDTLDQLGLFKVSAELIRPDILRAAAPFREKRALYKEYLARQYLPESVGRLTEQAGILDLLPGGDFSADRAYYTPGMSNLHWKDPETGRVYSTTQHAAERADWTNRKKELAEAAGVAAVTGGAFKALTSRYPWLSAPALLSGGLIGGSILKHQQMPTLKTVEGIDVPLNTEFVEKRSASVLETVVPLAGGALLTGLLAQDYGSVNPSVNPAIAQAAAQHPYLTTVGTSFGLGAGGHLLRNLRSNLMKRASFHPTDYDEVDLGELCVTLGLEILA